MDLDGRLWNLGAISNIFPNEIKEMIIKTPILELEQDSLMWVSSAIGDNTKLYHIFRMYLHSIYVNLESIWA